MTGNEGRYWVKVFFINYTMTKCQGLGKYHVIQIFIVGYMLRDML